MYAGADSLAKTADKGQRFVNYHLKYEEGDLEPRHILTFSSKERPPTTVSSGQGSHASSMAVLIQQLICIINDSLPAAADLDTEDTERGISVLVAKMHQILEKSEFLLGQFFPSTVQNEYGTGFKYDANNMYIRGQLGENGLPAADVHKLIDYIVTDLQITNERITKLKEVINFVETHTNNEKEKELYTSNLQQEAKQIRLEYNGRVAELISHDVLSCINGGFAVAFDHVYPRPANVTNWKELNELEKEFNNNDPVRIKGAIATLSGAEGNVSVDKLTNEDIITNIANLLNYPPVYKEYDDIAQAEYKDASNRRQQRSEGGSKQRIGRINKRTNDENIFCYIVANHIEACFTAFSWIGGLDEKRKECIVEGVIKRIIEATDRDEEFSWKRHLQPDVSIKIKNALTAWQKHQDKKAESDPNDFFDLSAVGITPIKSTASSNLVSSEINTAASGEESKSQDNVIFSSSQTSDSSYSKEEMTTQSSAHSSPIQSAIASSKSVSVSDRQKRAVEEHKKRMGRASGEELSGRTGGQFGRGYMPGAATARRQQLAKQNTSPPAAAVDEQRSTSATKNKPFKPGGGKGNADSSGSS